MTQSNISHYIDKFLSVSFNKLFISLSILIYFFSTYNIPYIGVISYSFLFFLLLLNINHIKFSTKEIKIYLALATFIAFKLFFSKNIYGSLNNIKFVFFFIIFLQIFKIYSLDFIMTRTTFYVLIFICLIDTILINTTFSPYLIHKETLVHYHKYFGFYLRSPAFAGSASVTSVCLIVFASILDIKKKLKFYDLAILLITILLLINTTGLIIFIIYLILKNYFFKNSFISLAITSLILISLFLMFYFFDVKVVEKFSYDYIKIVYEIKIIGIKYLLASNNYINLFFGKDIYLGFTDDFLSNIISSIGFLGFLIFIIIVIDHIKFNNLYIFPLILILIGSLHYQTVFTPAGVIFFTFILNNFKEKNFLK